MSVDHTQETFLSYVKDAKDGKISNEECVVLAKKYDEIEEYSMSFALYICAAMGGNEDAQEKLGSSFGSSLWPWAPNDDESIRIRNLQYSKEAQKWFELATEKFDADSQYKMGNYWKYDIGGILSVIEARAWWKVAAAQGHAEAQYSLGCEYYETAQKNDERRDEFLGLTIKYLKMASKQGHKKAAKLLASLERAENAHGSSDTPVARRTNSKAEKDFQKGAEHIKNNHYFLAIDPLRSAAKAGHAEAQFALGLIYMYGRGTLVNEKEAAKLCKKAAEQGLSVAQAYLGNIYENGNGVPQSYTEAAKWYGKAAKQGSALAQFYLAILYRKGEGVPQSDSEAARWFSKAVGLEDTDAQFTHGVPKDEEEGVQWLQKAAAQGYGKAADLLSELGEDLSVNEETTTNKKAPSFASHKVSAKAKEDFQKGSTRYYTENNLEEAVELLTSSAQEGYAKAKFYLGLCYLSGKGVNKDMKTASKWIKQAAEQGHARAQYCLADFYMNNMGVRKSNAKAAMWYRKAAEQGDDDAQYELGLLYGMGKGVPEDAKESLYWLQRAAVNGNSKAALLLYEREE